jgi:hypothetical protein
VAPSRTSSSCQRSCGKPHLRRFLKSGTLKSYPRGPLRCGVGRAPGDTRAPAATFERQLKDNLVALQNDLAQQTYQPGAYYNFYIHEPKRRLISAAPFRDRVVHHALCNVIDPLFERGFIFDSYANRVGKGTHRAL